MIFYQKKGVLFMNLYDKVLKIDVLDNALLNELVDDIGYGSRGTINMVVDLLTTLKERIKRGDKIRLEKTGEILTVDSFRRLVEDEFTIYVTKAVFKNTVLPHKVFFRIENFTTK